MTYNTAVESKIYATCPHSDGKGTPICWDCSEESWGSLPTLEDFGGVKRLRILNGRSQAFAPEVHPPAEGIEVGAPDPRNSQPGLEVFVGPQIVTPTDKYWDARLEKIVVPPSTPSSTILGLRRRIFWLVLICVVVALLVGVAVGVAVGVTQRNNSTKASPISSLSTGPSDKVSSTFISSPQIMTEIVSVTATSPSTTATNPSMTAVSQATIKSVPSSSSELETASTTTATKSSSTSSISTSSADKTSKSVEKVTVISIQTASISTTSPVQSTPPPTTVTVTPTSKTSSQSTASATTVHSDGSCLGADGSTYTDPGTGSQFRIECDIAHQGKDIDNYEAQSMEACVSMCADDSECVGAIWYSAGPQGTDLNYCWLKNTLEDNLKDTKDAQSVVRL
ncbi:hypothetical protein F4781DRAFT_435532 [Annulohypoxylon bovei var. microspora]|nr:hypothetical protein F4781DRAFT_435532 [Annulohypoxylon bovei var. microspora]